MHRLILIFASPSVYLATLLLGRLSPLRVNQYCAHSFTRNWQLPFLKRNDRRKYFMINLHERMLPAQRGRTHNLLITRWTRIHLNHRGRQRVLFCDAVSCHFNPGQLNQDMSSLCKRCRSRSVGFRRSRLIWIGTVFHSVCKFVWTTWIKQSDCLTIRSGYVILMYSAWQMLTLFCALGKSCSVNNCLSWVFPCYNNFSSSSLYTFHANWYFENARAGIRRIYFPSAVSKDWHFGFLCQILLTRVEL